MEKNKCGWKRKSGKTIRLEGNYIEDFSGKITALPNKLLVSETIENITASHFTKEVISMKLDLSIFCLKIKNGCR